MIFFVNTAYRSSPSIGTTHVHSNSDLPEVEMRIVDYNTQREVSSTEIGQELQLIIEMKPPKSKNLYFLIIYLMLHFEEKVKSEMKRKEIAFILSLSLK